MSVCVHELVYLCLCVYIYVVVLYLYLVTNIFHVRLNLYIA